MALILILFRGQFRLALANMQNILWQAALKRSSPSVERPKSAGSIPYGVAIAAATIYVLATRYA